MLAARDDLPHRRPVWEALSRLFLDTELDETDLEHIAAILAASLYTDPELSAIYHREVRPVCRVNLWVVAGVWSGFDGAWLEERILALRPRSARPTPEDWGWGGLRERVQRRRSVGA